MPYVTPPPKAVPFDKVDVSEIDLGRRFIHRIDQFKCWYVQLRASVEGTRSPTSTVDRGGVRRRHGQVPGTSGGWLL